MTTQKPAAERRLHRAVSLAAALLLASLPLAAQNRSRPSESGDTGRTAREAGPSPAPSYSPPPQGSGSSGGDRSSGSSQPRTARPSDGGSEPHRQPPSRGGRDDRGGHGGGSHHNGYYSGGYYYPYHYPYGWGNYGFWPGYYGWWWWGYPSYGYGNYQQPGYYERDRAGALDFDVYPARAEVFVDGQYLGKVDAFDGWPRYLWLPKGTYDVVLYLDGYKTIARQITVYPGTVIGIDDRLEPGDSVRPEDLASKSTERRDERTRYERERRERIDRGDRGERGDDYDEDWRDRVRRDRGRMSDHDRHDDQDRDDDDDRDVDVDEEDVRSSKKGRLVLDIEPEDASVYLDGRFVGTGSELALMRDGLPVTPGEHRLAIVRPGRKAEERKFDVDAGEEVEIEVELESESR